MIVRDMNLIQRLYRFLLRLYPHDFYAQFADEMASVFDQVWADARSRGKRAVIGFCLREVFGLIISIIGERLQNGISLRRLFQWRLMPFTLLAISVVLAAAISLSYWGYVTLPSTTLPTLQTYDSIALVQFEEDYSVRAIPIHHLPAMVTPEFPPSQILSSIQQRQGNITVSRSLDPALAEKLSAVLVAEGINLYASTYEYPSEPLQNDNGFIPGVQQQPDGSLLVIYPGFGTAGFTEERHVQPVTPDDWWYYGFVLPAGYLVSGQAEDGTPLVFLALATGAFDNDRFRYHELTFEDKGDYLSLRPRSISYNYDVAGLEGFGMFLMTMVFYVPLLLLWSVIGILRSIWRRTRRWRLA